MTDQFDRMIERFLTPLSDLGPRIKDSIYLLRKDGCFVFSHGYYHPTPGHFIGKIIYYPDPNGSAKIWGRRYQAIHKAWIKGVHVAIRNDVQIKKHYEIDHSLDPEVPRPLVADCTMEFSLSDFVGFFDPLRSLRICRDMYPQVKAWAEQTADLMDFPPEKLGVTGSLAYGKIEAEDMDFDVIFEGDLEENNRALKKLYQLAGEPERRVFEFGKHWPIRVYHGGFLICSFFVYQNWEDVPLAEAELELIRKDAEGTAVISDDFHNSYVPFVLDLADVEVNGKTHDALRLICYDGSIRGEYRKNDRIWFKGKMLNIKDKKAEYRAAVVDISYDIRKI